MTGIYILFGISLLASAIFSGIEIAFYVADKIRIELEHEKGNKQAKILSFFLNKNERFIITILIGNNLMLVLFGLASSRIFKTHFSYLLSENLFVNLLYETLAATLVILLFGEFFPKALFRSYPNKMLNLFIPVIFAFYSLFKPVILLIEKIQKKLFKPVTEETLYTEEELEEFISASITGHLLVPYKNIIPEVVKNALDFNELKVRDFMRPRTEIIGIPITATPEEAYEVFKQNGYSKYIVYEESLDDVKGYILIFDLLDSPKNLLEILKSLPVVPETMPAHLLADVFIESGEKMVLVVDEYGGTAGIVTLEDLMEEVVGDLMDEFEKDESIEYTKKKIDENTFLLGARLRVDEINEEFELDIPEDESYSTLGGWIMSLTGSVPEQGETLIYENLKITVKEASPNNIRLLEIRREG